MDSSRKQVVAFFMSLGVLAVAFLAGAGVASAARPAPPGSSGAEASVSSAAKYLETMPYHPAAAVVEKARKAVDETFLLARLPAGPSPRGPGH
jgi:hypothetical protein